MSHESDYVGGQELRCMWADQIVYQSMTANCGISKVDCWVHVYIEQLLSLVFYKSVVNTNSIIWLYIKWCYYRWHSGTHQNNDCPYAYITNFSNLNYLI